jgi:hypothetical protein
MLTRSKSLPQRVRDRVRGLCCSHSPGNDKPDAKEPQARIIEEGNPDELFEGPRTILDIATDTARSQVSENAYVLFPQICRLPVSTAAQLAISSPSPRRSTTRYTISSSAFQSTEDDGVRQETTAMCERLQICGSADSTVTVRHRREPDETTRASIPIDNSRNSTSGGRAGVAVKTCLPGFRDREVSQRHHSTTYLDEKEYESRRSSSCAFAPLRLDNHGNQHIVPNSAEELDVASAKRTAGSKRREEFKTCDDLREPVGDLSALSDPFVERKIYEASSVRYIDKGKEKIENPEHGSPKYHLNAPPLLVRRKRHGRAHQHGTASRHLIDDNANLAAQEQLVDPQPEMPFIPEQSPQEVPSAPVEDLIYSVEVAFDNLAVQVNALSSNARQHFWNAGVFATKLYKREAELAEARMGMRHKDEEIATLTDVLQERDEEIRQLRSRINTTSK